MLLDCASNESANDGSVGAANTRLAQAFEGLSGWASIEQFHATFLHLFVEHVRGFVLVRRHFSLSRKVEAIGMQVLRSRLMALPR